MSKPDGRYRGAVVEVDASVKSDAQTVETFRPGMRMPAVLAVAIVTSVASVVTTYMLTHATPADCASKGEVNALSVQVGTLSKDLSSLTTAVNSNANNLHNEIANLDTRLQVFTRQK